jgi:uncharacterized membrane protein YgcG
VLPCAILAYHDLQLAGTLHVLPSLWTWQMNPPSFNNRWQVPTMNQRLCGAGNSCLLLISPKVHSHACDLHPHAPTQTHAPTHILWTHSLAYLNANPLAHPLTPPLSHLPTLPFTDPHPSTHSRNLHNHLYSLCRASQLYMNPAARSAVLSLDDEDEARMMAGSGGADRGGGGGGSGSGGGGESRTVSGGGEGAPRVSTFYELQRIFSYLMLSDTQFFVPEGFWQT